MTPRRIQRKRSKGWRMPPGTVLVCRPGPWGNPYMTAPQADPPILAQHVVSMHRDLIEDRLAGKDAAWFRDRLNRLRGRNLACWCRLCPAHQDGKPFGVACWDCAPCHADTLGVYANQPFRCEAAA
jgi:hypothetical protein